MQGGTSASVRVDEGWKTLADDSFYELHLHVSPRAGGNRPIWGFVKPFSKNDLSSQAYLEVLLSDGKYHESNQTRMPWWHHQIAYDFSQPRPTTRQRTTTHHEHPKSNTAHRRLLAKIFSS